MEGFTFPLLDADEIVRSPMMPLIVDKMEGKGLAQFSKRINGAGFQTRIPMLERPFKSEGESLAKDSISHLAE